jgi:hypothetical protein
MLCDSIEWWTILGVRSRWLRTMRPRLDDVGHARSEAAPIVW